MIPGGTATRYAAVGLANIAREYPNHPGHVLAGPEDLSRATRDFHPVFYGSYDWHSAVHQHWMLLRLLRAVPSLPLAPAIREAFTERLTAAAVGAEVAYFATAERRSFERPYGWAWLLALHAEAASWRDADARRWASRLSPLADLLRERCAGWLASPAYPERSGTHANSAFAAGLVLDAARSTGAEDLLESVKAAARRWYGEDAAYPAWLEPSATDFLSPALVEADLMTRVLAPGRFAPWFARFLPDPAQLERPVAVVGRADAQFVHLDGLNLSRAWCWRRIAAALPVDHPRRELAEAAADRHARAGLPHACTSEYVGDHWLPTFAVYLLTGGTDPVR